MNFNDLTKNEIYDEITKAETLMINKGYNKGSAFISVPSARLNTKSYEALIQTNARIIFHNWGGYTGINDYKIFCPYYPTTRMLNTSTLDSENTLEQMILQCQKAAELKGIAVNGFHGTFWEKDNGTSWKAYIDAISQIEGLNYYGIEDIAQGNF